jgi:predicted dehydrogenase
MSRLRIGLAGAGFAANFHLDCYRRIYGEDFEVAAICGRNPERVRALADRFKVPVRYASFDEMIEDPAIHAVDLCVPAHLHVPFILKAVERSKHVICEKPLGGYFGPPGAPPDWMAHDTSRGEMLDQVVEQSRAVKEAVARAGVSFCYAENWVYAPPITKVNRLMAASGSTILRIEAEESHSGSHAAYSRRWINAGGGSLARMCVHPIGGALHLKRQEGLRRNGEPIRPQAVLAQVANLTRIQAFTEEKRHHIATGWLDVEDWVNIVITFSDGSVAQLTSTDTQLGGIRNTLTAHGSRAVATANINPSNACVAYTPDGEYFRDEYIVEKIETKQGWTFPAPDEEAITGYPQELRDFVNAMATGRSPDSDLDLAIEVMLIVYAGYLSAQRGERVELQEYRARLAG